MVDPREGEQAEVERLRSEVARLRAALARREAGLRTLVERASHDLPAPLRSTRIQVELLRRRHGAAIPPEAQGVLQDVVASVAEAQQRIREFVALLQLEHQPHRSEPVDLARTAAFVIRALDRRRRAEGATISVGALPTVDGDPRELRDLLQYLVEDALDHRGDRPARIAIDATVAPEAVTITVEDAGVACEPGDAARLLGPFQRRSSGQDRNGLGLAICARIVERHGGTIGVTPGQDGGARVDVVLPRRPERG